MKSAKKKITSCVQAYIAHEPTEFAQFQEAITQKRDGLEDTQFGTAKGASMRVLFEVPETLHEMIQNSLDEEELDWLYRGGKDKKQGALWFAKTFPAFTIPSDV